jgi:hypothetical protein
VGIRIVSEDNRARNACEDVALIPLRKVRGGGKGRKCEGRGEV